jgi:exodeoxyribonuclease VII large subunit
MEARTIEKDLDWLRQRSDEAYTRLVNLMTTKMDSIKHKMDIYIERLNGLSPLNKLKSGYSVVKNEQDSLIKSVDDIKIEDKICISFIDGDVTAKVEHIDEKCRIER